MTETELNRMRFLACVAADAASRLSTWHDEYALAHFHVRRNSMTYQDAEKHAAIAQRGYDAAREIQETLKEAKPVVAIPRSVSNPTFLFNPRFQSLAHNGDVRLMTRQATDVHDMTPAQARELAAALIKAAEEVEARK